MKRRGLAVLVFVLLALPFVLGATDIKVKTLPGYDVHVNFAQTGDTYSLVKSLNLGKADNDGLAAGVFDEGGNTEVNAYVQKEEHFNSSLKHNFKFTYQWIVVLQKKVATKEKE